MRIDGNDGANWSVWHSEQMQEVRNCAFCDDLSNQFGVLVGIIPTGPIVNIYQAKKIVIYPEIGLVLINPIPPDIDRPKPRELNASPSKPDGS